MFTKELGKETCKVKPDDTIGPTTILIPVLGVVFPPLIGALVVLYLWEKIDSDCAVGKIADSLSDTDSISTRSAKCGELCTQVEL